MPWEPVPPLRWRQPGRLAPHRRFVSVARQEDTSHSDSSTGPAAPGLRARRGPLASWLLVCVASRCRHGAAVRRDASPSAACPGQPAGRIVGQKLARRRDRRPEPARREDRRPEAGPPEGSSAGGRSAGRVVGRRPARQRDRRPETGPPAPPPNIGAEMAMTKRSRRGGDRAPPPPRLRLRGSCATHTSDASEACRLRSAASPDQAAATTATSSRRQQRRSSSRQQQRRRDK